MSRGQLVGLYGLEITMFEYQISRGAYRSQRKIIIIVLYTNSVKHEAYEFYF